MHHKANKYAFIFTILDNYNSASEAIDKMQITLFNNTKKTLNKKLTSLSELTILCWSLNLFVATIIAVLF